MELELITVNPKDYGLTPDTAESIVKALPAILEERLPLAEQYKEIIVMDIEDPKTAKKAKEVRLLIKNNRTKGIENWHKVNKEFFLKGGQFIDAIKRKEVAENERMEEALEQIEKYQEIKEQKRIEALNIERTEIIKQYIDDTTGLGLGKMPDDVFDAFLTAKKSAYEQRIADEKKAEEERIAKEQAEAEERERMRLENERLKKEAEEKEKELAAERERVEQERKAAEAKAKLEREEIERKAEEERLRQYEILRKEREEKERIEKELREIEQSKAEAERLRIEEEKRLAKEAEKLAKAPVKKQLTQWVSEFKAPETAVDNEVKKEIEEKFESFKKWAAELIEKM